MIKREKINYKIISKRDDRAIFGVLYNILQIRNKKKYIKISKHILIPIKTEKKTYKNVIVWKPNSLTALPRKFYILESRFDNYLTDFNKIKIEKEVKNKKLLKILTN